MRKRDDTLPSVSSSEVEQRQEGGYADVTAPAESASDTGANETSSPENGSSAEGTVPSQNTQAGEEVLP